TIIPAAFTDSACRSFEPIASRARLSRKAGTTPSAAEVTISASRPVRRPLYGRKSRPTRRRFARRTAGSAGRSGAARAGGRDIPISVQRTRSGNIESVRVTVRLFAGLRERAGTGRVELDDVVRVADVWSRLDLGAEPDGLLYAVNREYADAGRALADGDEV